MAEIVLTALGSIFLGIVALILIGLAVAVLVAICKLIWSIIHDDY